MFRFRMLFALIGALGCLTAALSLELVFRSAHLASRLDDRIARVLIIRSEDTQRLEEAGARTGDVQITLSWHNRNDLDLICIDPRGETIAYDNLHSRSGGSLDVDSNRSGTTLTNHPVEFIHWPYGGAPAGRYRVFVNHFSNNGDPDPTPFKVSVLEKGKLHEFEGSVSHSIVRQQPRLIYEFSTTDSNFLWSGLLPAILRAALITGCWAMLMGLLFTSVVWAGQGIFFRRYYKERLLRRRAVWSLIGWGTLSGLLAGVGGQLVFSLLSSSLNQFSIEVQRYIGWLVMSGLFGWLIARRMPNLPSFRALAGGIIGGWLGALMLVASLRDSSGDWGRMGGALLLGAFVGGMIVLFAPDEEPEEPIEERRVSLQGMRLRPQRGSSVGALRPNRK